MNDERLMQAVHNNAAWCDTVCRSHGQPGEFREGIWLNRGKVPLFYPNAMTLLAEMGVSAQLAAIRDLMVEGPPGGWGVKDSFCTLDLALLGFRVLFEAQWIYRTALQPEPETSIPGVHWARITETAELARWEAAWRGEPANKLGTDQTSIFLPSLLADETIAFIAAYRQGQIVAGAIANRTGEVVGLSNLFVPGEAKTMFWAGCVAGVMVAFPGLPVVGYERGDDLAIAQTLGFESLGPLRVWLRD
jgi:hypothetical protein